MMRKLSLVLIVLCSGNIAGAQAVNLESRSSAQNRDEAKSALQYRRCDEVIISNDPAVIVCSRRRVGSYCEFNGTYGRCTAHISTPDSSSCICE
jgi:hypothetical protein